MATTCQLQAMPNGSYVLRHVFGALRCSVIVVFVVANAMSMAIIERTREIGTLRALGTLQRQLLQALALEGMVLSSSTR